MRACAHLTLAKLHAIFALLCFPPPASSPQLRHTVPTSSSQNTEFTIKLKELEDELLYKLANAEGDITEDVELIESLEESKRVATEISLKGGCR
jgi:hypothetical protein